MKGLSPSQLEALTEKISELGGGHLQKFAASERDFVLGLWTKAGLTWLWIDTKASEPYLALLEDLPAQELKKKPPLLNFVKAHGEGLPLTRAEFHSDKGRVLDLYFSDGKKWLSLEIRLIPHAPNIIATAGAGEKSKPKQVSWGIVKDLGEFNKENLSGVNEAELEASLKQWLKRFEKTSAKALTEDEIKLRYEKEVEKKKKALEKVRDEVTKKQDPRWRNLGEWLKTNQSLKVPGEWSELVDPKQSLAINIEKSFKKAKENDAKLEGTLERLNVLVSELDKILGLTPAQWFDKNRPAPSRAGGKKLTPDFNARSLVLSPDIKVFFGKSGADNLKLLRQARAWDYWVHLKDEPGSHGVVFRPKSKELEFSFFKQIAAKLVEYSLGEKAKSRVGDRFEMLICEVRYVNPIKGDRLGRVNYHSEKVMGFVYQG